MSSVKILGVTKWWGKNSVHVDKDCKLHELKTALISELQQSGVSVIMDRQNENPHINLDGDENIRIALHNSNYQFDWKHLKLHSDHIALDVGFGKHMTLVFDKLLVKTNGPDKILQILQKVLKSVMNIEVSLEELKSNDHSNLSNNIISSQKVKRPKKEKLEKKKGQPKPDQNEVTLSAETIQLIAAEVVKQLRLVQT